MKEFIDFQTGATGEDGAGEADLSELRRYGSAVFAMTAGEYIDPAVTEYLKEHEEEVRRRAEALESSSEATAQELAKTPLEIWDLPSNLGAETFRDENHHGNK